MHYKTQRRTSTHYTGCDNALSYIVMLGVRVSVGGKAWSQAQENGKKWQEQSEDIWSQRISLSNGF